MNQAEHSMGFEVIPLRSQESPGLSLEHTEFEFPKPAELILYCPEYCSFYRFVSLPSSTKHPHHAVRSIYYFPL
jgi:hypothetical protein